MDTIEFIDCNCMIGPRAAPAQFGSKSTQDVKRILIESGIDKALAYHSRSIEYHPIEGNVALMNDVAGQDFFIPVWVVIPGYTGEFPGGEKLRAALKENNAAAIKVHPEQLGHSMSTWSMGDIYNSAQELKLPILIQASHITWDMLNEVLNNFPKLNIILTSAGYRMGRYIYPLMAQHENLYLEISMYKNHLGLEHLCEAFGARRILYGSGMPEFLPGCAKAMVLKADITREEKKEIAKGNILRLIGERYD